MRVAEGFFWLGVLWLGYVWIGYPLILVVAARVRRFQPLSTDNYYPKVSVLISARNEEKDIAWKLAQTLAWDYPEDRLEVIVGSDASTDGTDDAIRSVRDPRMRFIRNAERAGKNKTLNRLARMANGDLLCEGMPEENGAAFCGCTSWLCYRARARSWRPRHIDDDDGKQCLSWI